MRISDWSSDVCSSDLATKICNQIISAGTVAAIAEALTLAESAGVTVEQFPAALAGGWADSPLLRHYAPRMIAGEFQGSTRTMLKALQIACALAQTANARQEQRRVGTECVRKGECRG